MTVNSEASTQAILANLRPDGSLPVPDPSRIFFRLSDGSVVKLGSVDSVSGIELYLGECSYSIGVGSQCLVIRWNPEAAKDAKEHELCRLSLLMALGVWDA